MEAEKKAKELVWLFLPLIEGWTDDKKTEVAKKYALKCVDEMIKSNPMVSDDFCDCGNDYIETFKVNTSYWQEVKEEISKL